MFPYSLFQSYEKLWNCSPECVLSRAGQDRKTGWSGNILDKFKLPILQPHLSTGNGATIFSSDVSPVHSQTCILHEYDN